MIPVNTQPICRFALLRSLRPIFHESCELREKAQGYDPNGLTACTLRAESDGIDFAIGELAGRFGIEWEEIEEEP